MTALTIFLVIALIMTACGQGNNSNNQGSSSGTSNSSGNSGTSGNSGGSGSSGGNSGSNAADDKVYEIKIAYDLNPGEPIDLGAQEWKRLIEERSNGRLKVELFPSGVLGTKKDVVEQMLTGTNVIQVTDGSYLMEIVPDFGVLAGPYLVTDYRDLFKVIDSEWFDEQVKLLNDKGYEMVSAKWLFGTRHLIATKPVEKPEDFKGMKVRVPNNPLFIKAFELMGASVTPLPWLDVYPSLTQKVVDGAEAPVQTIYSSKLQEAAKYLSLTGHVTMAAHWIAGKEFMDSLPDDLRQILIETGNEAGEYTTQLVLNGDSDTIEQMKSEGVNVIEPDQSLFQQAVKNVYNEIPEFTPGVYDRIQEIIAQN
jgi:tripartite ATP-independent transporter DctP family solute receptor